MEGGKCKEERGGEGMGWKCEDGRDGSVKMGAEGGTESGMKL